MYKCQKGLMDDLNTPTLNWEPGYFKMLEKMVTI